MNVAILTTPDGNGATRAAAALREGLRQLGHDAAVIVLEAEGDGAGLASHPLVRQADVLSLHGFSAPGSVASLRGLLDAGKPVVWTLYDHGPFTGGCRAPGTCTQFERDCAACPQLPDPDAVRGSFALSLEVLRGRRLVVAAASRDLANAARRSRMFGAARVRPAAQDGDPVLAHLRVFEEVLADEARPGEGPAASKNGALAKESPPLPPSASPGAQGRGALRIHPPEVTWAFDSGADYRPSWSRAKPSLGPEHDSIWEATKHLAGWQEPADSLKLYELGYHAGEVILEIGVFAGRSAVVELKGALAAGPERPPQYYGIDVDPGFLSRTLPVVDAFGLSEPCLFYHGNLEQLLADLPVVPTMVFVDGDHRYPGVKADLDRLATWLAPGTPVLCHDYRDEEGVRRAVDEAVASGGFTAAGVFGCSALLVARGAEGVSPRGLDAALFAEARRDLLRLYDRTGLLRGNGGAHTPAGVALDRARRALSRVAEPATTRAPWPYAPVPGTPLPATLPDGSPWPRISIVTPSFNQGSYLEETILSVLNQGYPEVEHIVVDGGSSDDTGAVLAKYRASLAVCLSEPDRGQSHALNKGFARATGEILTWLNSDDMLAPGALAGMALAFHGAPDADVVAGICEVYRDGELIEKHLTSCRPGPLPLGDLLDLERCWLAGQFFYQPEVFFRRRIWERAGGYVDGSMHYSMDYDLWVRFAEAGARLDVVGRPVVRFRSHAEQKTAGGEIYRPELERVCSQHRARLHLPPAPPAPAVLERRLRVAMLNDVGFRYGAGIGHGRIAKALAAAGHDVRPLAVWFDGIDERRRRLPFDDELRRRLRELEPDAVIVGNVHAAGMPTRVLDELARTYPTVLVLHDEWLLTGRCAYRGECALHVAASGCDATCQTHAEYPALEPGKIHDAWEEKRRLLLSPSRAVLAANSRWMLDEIALVASATGAAAGATVKAAHVMHLGLCLDTFRPRDMSTCRDALGLPQDRFIVLFSSTALDDRRKGAHHLVEALSGLHLPQLFPVAMGANRGGALAALPEVHFTGYVNDDRTRAMLFSAADVFVAPSLHEAFGQVLVEAAACGTPSIAYDVGGTSEALLDGTSGVLVRTTSPEAFAGAIAQLCSRPDLRRSLGAWGRLRAENDFSLERSYHHFHAVLAGALARAGVALAPKLRFPAEPARMAAMEYLLAPFVEPWELDGAVQNTTHPASAVAIDPYQPVERIVLRYFVDRLRAFRKRRTPWYLLPGAWLAKLNRRVLRKEVQAKARRLPGARGPDR